MSRIALLFVLVALAVATAASAAPAARTSSRICATVAGPTVHRAGTTVRRYTPVAHAGVSCAFARTWTTKLVNRRWPNGMVTNATGGPAGWKCFLTIVFNHVAIVGACQKGSSGFGWGAGK
jgi:type IV secretory pathway VirB2 component (pilin)